MRIGNYYSLHRTACDVLEELRKLDSTKNYSPLLSLVEELQNMYNRMEAALYDLKDYDSMKEEMKDLKSEIKILNKKRKSLEAKDE